MLEVRDLHVRYGKVDALRGVSLDIAEGEAIGLIGPNGAGKTTLLSAVFGLVNTTSGSIRFEDADLGGVKPERIVRRGLSLVPEGRHIFGTLTVRENLMVGTSPRRGSLESLDEELDKVHELFPILLRYADAPAGRLSGGEQQQLAIGRALLAQPRLLALDEPSLGLAPLVVDSMFEVLQRLREAGVTVFVVEQNVARTVKFADRSYVLQAGKVVLSGDREQLSEDVDFASFYLGAGA